MSEYQLAIHIYESKIPAAQGRELAESMGLLTPLMEAYLEDIQIYQEL